MDEQSRDATVVPKASMKDQYAAMAAQAEFYLTYMEQRSMEAFEMLRTVKKPKTVTADD